MAAVSDKYLTDGSSLKAWLDISEEDILVDGLLQRLIESASSTFLILMQRKFFVSQVVVETLLGSGSNRLSLEATPVTAISTLVSPSKTFLYATTPNSLGYRFDSRGVTLYGDQFFVDEYYTVTYTGGFSLTSAEVTAAEQAVIAMCTLWYKRRKHADQLAVSMGNQITNRFIDDDIPKESRLIAEKLKKVA